MKKIGYGVAALAVLVAALVLLPAPAFSHCDTLDGPVVKAARKALETGDIDLVLIWVQKRDEAEIQSVFRKTLAVRKAGPEARDLADRYFFETLVRLHRAGEGAPYTGLKPSGLNLGPAIPAADKAIESGRPDALAKFLTDVIQTKLTDLFGDLKAKKYFQASDVEAGRAYVRAYVEFIHYVERLYEAAATQAAGHAPEREEATVSPHSHKRMSGRISSPPSEERRRSHETDGRTQKRA